MRTLIDTDPSMGVLGGDPEDAFAILMGLNSPELDVVGVSVVNGNVPAGLGYANAKHLLALHGSDAVPLAAGPERPLMPYRDKQLAWQRKKLDLPRITPHAAVPAPGSSPELIARSLLESQEKTSIVAIGPLTNLALALLLEPTIVSAVDRLVIMGGTGREAGNVTPAAEFNFWCDPEAAAVVLDADWPITLVTLEVCHQVRLTRSALERVQSSSDLAKFVHKSCAAWLDSLEQTGESGIPMFDTLTLAMLLEPEIVQTRPAFVEVDTTRGPSQGASAIWIGQDILGEPLVSTNADVSVGVDAERFLTLFEERVLAQL